MVEEAIKIVKLNKSLGPDMIHLTFIYETEKVIKIPLAHIFNNSIEDGKLPDPLKFANVGPIFKKVDKSERGNHGPISLTSVPSKILQTMIRDLDKVLKHMTDNNLFTIYQKRISILSKHWSNNNPIGTGQ